MKRKSSFFQKIILVVCFYICIYSVSRFYFEKTDGFGSWGVTTDAPGDFLWDIKPLSNEELDGIRNLLDQDFFYIGKGCQQYVFKSQDEKYVIKLFKYKHLKPSVLATVASYFPYVNRFYYDKLEAKKLQRSQIFESCKLAYDKLRDETDMVYIHLNKTDKLLDRKLTFYDKLGRKHTFDSDGIEFVVQKKASLFMESLLAMMRENKVEKAKKLIFDLITLFVSEYQRGFLDYDRALLQNTGVYQDTPIQIDSGKIIYDVSCKDPKVYGEKLKQKLQELIKKLQPTYPDLAAYTEEEVEKVINKDMDNESISCSPW